MSQYIPTVNEGIYPQDAGWTEDEQQQSILLLSIPELVGLANQVITKFDYAWLFDSSINAYIFCFRVNEKEYAVIFQFNHAGKFLLEREAYESFSIAITGVEFSVMTEHTPYALFQPITLNRQPVAGW
ncbi:hypothetical protein JOC85_001242 [Bacillus mesophilus]|uniref:Uncharacterized protein n=1 Tax=Bacillus mesophilus TaxID=1808955 RepID=A0A6M0Q8A3_9BACI|nr:hypothetical protein [Bacillus mesophilus]MBM7660470.1 hypothetical protein [Bacillus mesophilus]NEY71979.1 hypothetical protein [Bacillus mesophilus]